MRNCIFVHPDNIDRMKDDLNVSLAVVARPDRYMEANDVTQVIVETGRDVHTRCYLAEEKGIRFLIVYGRFNRVRTTSHGIDFESTQEVFNMMGVTHIVGTFVVGSLRPEDMAGKIYVPDDIIGLGPYDQALSKWRPTGFRTVDMLTPFCSEMRAALVKSAEAISSPVQDGGTYACFHGWPRLETRAELNHYVAMGCDMVGQTLDPEATLAKESGCCYAALAVTIDDQEIRDRFLAGDQSGVEDIQRHTAEGRKRTFEIFLKALPSLVNLEKCDSQAKEKRGINMDFYYRPSYLIERKQADE